MFLFKCLYIDLAQKPLLEDFGPLTLSLIKALILCYSMLCIILFVNIIVMWVLWNLLGLIIILFYLANIILLFFILLNRTYY